MAVQIRERFKQLSRAPIDRTAAQKTAVIEAVDKALQNKAPTGGNRTKVAAKLVKLYRSSGGDLRIITKSSMQDYYAEVTRVLLAYDTRPDIPITNYILDGRALIDDLVAKAPSKAMAGHTEAAAREIIFKLEEKLAAESWKGLGVHHTELHRNVKFNPDDYFDRMNNWINARKEDPRSIYNLALHEMNVEAKKPEGPLN